MQVFCFENLAYLVTFFYQVVAIFTRLYLGLCQPRASSSSVEVVSQSSISWSNCFFSFWCCS